MLARGAAEQIVADYVEKGLVRYVFRHYPFLGDESYWSAEAAECAATRNRFWSYHDKLFTEWAGENVGALSIPNLKRFAQEVGLEPESFNACLDGGKFRDRVAAEKVEAASVGVSTAPTVFINGQVVTGNRPYEVYQEVIERELREAQRR